MFINNLHNNNSMNTIKSDKTKTINHYKATAVLGLVTGGFFIAHPFHANFWGGLFDGAFKAAMVGGLADWFAVTALFRRPLGIPWFTEVIPKNRENIFQSIVDMVQNELLTKENVINKLENYNISQVLIDYLEKDGGKETVLLIVNSVLQDVALTIRPGTTGTMAQKLLLRSAENIRVSPLLAKAIHWSLANGYDDKIITFGVKVLARFVEHPKMLKFIEAALNQAKVNYEQGQSQRQIMDWILEKFFTGSMDRVAQKVQEKIVMHLYDMLNQNHEFRIKIKGWLANIALRLEKDVSLQTEIENWKMQILQNTGLKKYIGKLVMNFHYIVRNSNPEVTNWFKKILLLVDSKLKQFQMNLEEQEKFDQMIKKGIIVFLDSYYEHIGQVVRSRLELFTNDSLVSFIEMKVGNDLQMIRINGSFVGGLAGAVFYLFTYWFNV